MHCPYCGSEHNLSSPCNEGRLHEERNPRQMQDKPPVGLDNPFWKPEEPAAASL